MKQFIVKQFIAKQCFLSIAFFTLFAQTIISQTAQESPSSMNAAQLSISFYDKTLYYPHNAEDNPINVKVTIANKGSQTIRFKLADDRMFSIDFSAVNAKNRKLPYTQETIRKRSTQQTVFFREIALEPGEEYSFIENLKNYISITDPAIYYSEVYFYPELYKSPENPSSRIISTHATEKTEQTTQKPSLERLTSNKLTVEIKPAVNIASISGLPTNVRTGEFLQPEPISPDKVVEFTIVARQRSLWDQYFLYFDIEQMLVNDAARNRRYRSESAEQRARMLENYKLDLRQARIDRDIVAVPESFLIEKTSYTQTEGSVSVIQWFNYDTFKEKKRYTYRLRQRDGIWQIHGYTVENLGTE
ncbi:MAG: hypothetical protein ACRC4W_04305 [Treponemataceae bacterium]